MMNIKDFRQLREALETWDRIPIGENVELVSIMVAARQTLDRWQECECGGIRPSMNWECANDCGGSGVLPNQARLGAPILNQVGNAIQVAYDEHPASTRHLTRAFRNRIAEAAIIAYELAAVRAFDKETG